MTQMTDWGSRTTFGDFNGDGLDDLVITAPKRMSTD
ncbi:MAG: hypothetical protein CM15mP49_35580 [Actinomycetota bacterium]|nr:MAG: hypothetical protein CM15mP49_35580 [Actinomycetota bacterium]